MHRTKLDRQRWYLVGFLFEVLLPCLVSLVAASHVVESVRRGGRMRGVTAPEPILLCGQTGCEGVRVKVCSLFVVI